MKRENRARVRVVEKDFGNFFYNFKHVFFFILREKSAAVFSGKKRKTQRLISLYTNRNLNCEKFVQNEQKRCKEDFDFQEHHFE